MNYMSIDFENSLDNYVYYRGRVALYEILRSLDIKAGDRVITQAFTCVAVPEAIMAAGAKPEYVDIETNGFNMDVVDLQDKITKDVKAIIVQHTYGIPAEMGSILSLASKHDIPVIEDCCHTLKSKYRGIRVGNFGVASFYSYEWGKPLVIGIGGSAVINDEKLNEKIKLSYEGLSSPSILRKIRIQLQYLAFSSFYRPELYWPIKYVFNFLGNLRIAEGNYHPLGGDYASEEFGWKMPTFLKRRLARKLEKLDKQTNHSNWVSKSYRNKIKKTGLTHPKTDQDVHAVFVRYPFISKDKQELIENAKTSGIELADWYNTPVHPLSGVELEHVNYKIGSCKNAEKRCNEVVTLPTNQFVGRRFVERAVKFMNSQG